VLCCRGGDPRDPRVHPPASPFPFTCQQAGPHGRHSSYRAAPEEAGGAAGTYRAAPEEAGGAAGTYRAASAASRRKPAARPNVSRIVRPRSCAWYAR
jgi:hypothetical protein